MEKTIHLLGAILVASVTGSVSGETSSIVGSYYIANPEEPTHDNVVFVFLPNGEYFFAQDGDPNVDPNGQDGMERGTYTWDAATGVFSVNVITDTNGQWGLSNMGPNPTITMAPNGNHFELDPDEGEDDVVILRRVIGGAQVLSTWSDELGLTGSDAEPEARPFSDGLPNLVRYALGLGASPAPEEYPSFGQNTEGGDSFIFEYSQRKTLVGVELVAQSSVDLIIWEDIPGAMVNPVQGDDPFIQRNSVEIPTDINDSAYLRLEARLLD